MSAPDRRAEARTWAMRLSETLCDRLNVRYVDGPSIAEAVLLAHLAELAPPAPSAAPEYEPDPTGEYHFRIKRPSAAPRGAEAKPSAIGQDGRTSPHPEASVSDAEDTDKLVEALELYRDHIKSAPGMAKLAGRAAAALRSLLAARSRASQNAYPHMCRYGHEQIGHSVSDYEPEELSCPACRAINRATRAEVALEAECASRSRRSALETRFTEWFRSADIDARARDYAHAVKQRAGPQALNGADLAEFSRRMLERALGLLRGEPNQPKEDTK